MDIRDFPRVLRVVGPPIILCAGGAVLLASDPLILKIIGGVILAALALWFVTGGVGNSSDLD